MSLPDLKVSLPISSSTGTLAHASLSFLRLFVLALRVILCVSGGAENDGHEIAGHEIDGPSCRA